MTQRSSGPPALAKRKNKAVIVYYTRTNCPPCNVLQSRLRREEVAAAFREGYVFTAVWGTSMRFNERQHYRHRYGVFGAPTWLVFNSGGDYVCTSSGGFITDDGGKVLHQAVQLLLKEGPHGAGKEPKRCVP